MFGMGTGGSLRLLPPEIFLGFASRALNVFRFSLRASPPDFLLAFPSAPSVRSSFRLPLLPRFRLPLSVPASLRSSRAPLTFKTAQVFLTQRSASLASALPAPAVPASAFPFRASLDQALDLLVSSSSIRCRTSTDDLSTSSSLRGLTLFQDGNSLLQGGFTLRCLQRLSLPHFASQLCPWQNNCFTRGASIPVLSY